MVVHLVEIFDGLDVVGTDVLLVVEALDAAPDADVAVEDDWLFVFGAAAAVDVHVGLLVGFDPLFDLDDTRAVVDVVGYVGGLRGDGADLADEGYLGYVGGIDLEVLAVGRGLVGGEDLFYGYWPEGFVLVGLGEEEKGEGRGG